MFEEEMAEKLFRFEEENKLMNQHHDDTRKLEYKHMKVLLITVMTHHSNDSFQGNS